MAVEVEGLNLNISADSSNIGKVASDLNLLKAALKGFSSSNSKKMTAFAESINKFSEAIGGSDVSKVTDLINALSRFSEIKGGGLTSIGKGLENLKYQLDNMKMSKFYEQVNSLTRILQPLADILDKIGSNIKTISSFKGGIKATESITKSLTGRVSTTKTKKAADKSAFEDIKDGIKQVSPYVEKFINLVEKGLRKVGEIASVGAKGLEPFFNPFKGIVSSIEKANKSLKNLFNSIKRIAIYRLIRSVLKEISKGIKEGIENLYQWSKVTGGDFAPAMDKIATAMLYFKNSVAAAVSPLITYFAPAIDLAVDKIVALINVVNQFIARITGRATWTAALKYPVEYAEKAAGATKKIKDNIQSFDELHILTTPSGGSGADALDYSKMFEERDFDEDVVKWVDDLKAAITKGDWKGAGEILGGAVNTMFASIPWGTLGTDTATKVNNVFTFAYSTLKTMDFTAMGSDIATFLNNAIGTLDTETIGKTFARKWTAIIDFLYGFVSTFDFKNFGLKISQYVQGWFEEIDGKKIAVTLSEAIKGIFDAGIAFLSNKKTRMEIGKDISDFFNNIDYYGLLVKSIELVGKIGEAMLELFKQVYKSIDWKRIRNEISSAIAKGLTSGDKNKIAGEFGEFIVQVIRIGFEIKSTIIETAIKVALRSAIVNAFSGISIVGLVEEMFRGEDSIAAQAWGHTDTDTVSVSTGATQTLASLFSAAPLVSSVLNKVTGNSKNATKNITANAKSMNKSVTQSYTEMATTINDRLTETFDTTDKSHANIAKNVIASASSIKSSMSDAMISVNDKTRNTASNITSMFRTVTTSATADLTSMKNGAVSTYDSMAKAVTTPLNTLKTNTVNGFKSVKDGGLAEVNSLSSSVNNSFKTMNTNVKTTLDTAKKDWTNKFTGKDGIVSSLKDAASGITDGIKDAFSDAKSGALDSVKSLKEGVAGHFNGVIGASEGMSDGVVSGMNKVIDSFKALHFKIPDWVPDKSLRGKEWKMDISKVDSVKSGSFGRIKLAKGGIVTSPTTALIGEAGKEAVVPLERNTGWLDAIAERVGGTSAEEMALLREQNEYLREIASKEFGISERAIFNAVRNENRNFTMRTGKSLLAT